MTTMQQQPDNRSAPPREKVVVWHDPAVLARAGEELSGREILEAIADGRLPQPPMAALIGARLTTGARPLNRLAEAVQAGQAPDLAAAQGGRVRAGPHAAGRQVQGARGGQASEIAHLRGRAKRVGVKELLGQLARYQRLVELGALEIDMRMLPRARRRALEAVGRRMTAQQGAQIVPRLPASAPFIEGRGGPIEYPRVHLGLV